MVDGERQDEQRYEIRCECGFLMGFSCAPLDENYQRTFSCIFCESERDFFLRTFSDNAVDLFVYGTIGEDQNAWRRGLMHSRKQSIRWAYEDIMSKKDDQDE